MRNVVKYNKRKLGKMLVVEDYQVNNWISFQNRVKTFVEYNFVTRSFQFLKLKKIWR